MNIQSLMDLLTLVSPSLDLFRAETMYLLSSIKIKKCEHSIQQDFSVNTNVYLVLNKLWIGNKYLLGFDCKNNNYIISLS